MFMLLRWWFILSLSVCGAVVGGVFGLYEYIHKVDASYLSFVTMAVFALMTLFVGALSWSARHGDQGFVKHLPFCWYSSEVMLGLGMMGTLIGFMIMLQGAFAGNFDLANTENAKKILAQMAVGFATAGMTTLVGLACSLVLKAQLINLEYMIDENSREC